jgi:L-glutamine-phosphate cytidylyltransferase
MKAVILAAGNSVRMGGIPKPLLKIKDSTLIELNISKLTNFLEISEIVIVIGHKKDLIMNVIGNEYNGMKITYVCNNEFRKTNSSFSMWLVRDLVQEGFIVMNGDTLVSEKHLERILEETCDSSVLIDIFFTKFTYEDLKVSIDNNFLVKNIGKDIILNDKTYGCPAIYKFQKSSVKAFFRVIEDSFIKNNSLKSLLSKAIQIYSAKFDISAIYIEENIFWIDIDTPDDYQDAINYLDSCEHY